MNFTTQSGEYLHLTQMSDYHEMYSHASNLETFWFEWVKSLLHRICFKSIYLALDLEWSQTTGTLSGLLFVYLFIFSLVPQPLFS